MKPDLSRRNVARLAREYGLPAGAVRQMLTMEAGTNHGDVIATPAVRGPARRAPYLAAILAVPVIVFAAFRLL